MSMKTEKRSVWLPELTDLNTYVNAERRNRFIGAKIKKDMTELCMWLMRGKGKFSKITKIEFYWVHGSKRKDFDNVEFSQKWIRDGMVKAGLIPNDGWLHFPPETHHYHEVGDKPGVMVSFEGIKA